MIQITTILVLQLNILLNVLTLTLTSNGEFMQYRARFGEICERYLIYVRTHILVYVLFISNSRFASLIV